MKEYKINFINQNLIITVDEGMTVAHVCERAGFPLNLVCNGRGTCGKCKVSIDVNNKKYDVLACGTKIYSDLIIYLKEEDYKYNAKILEPIQTVNEFNPYIIKNYKDIADINNSTAGEFIRSCDLFVLQKFSELIYKKTTKGITFVNYEDKIIDVQLNDTRDYSYGAAIDIGTTTVAAYIYDLNNGKLLKTYSELNKQISMGADVLSRIENSQDKTGLKELNGKILLTLNNMVKKAEIDLPNIKENLYNITLCGNSTMQHLLLNLMPDSLGVSPFNCITKDYVHCWSSDIGIDCTRRSKITFLPLLGGFVGSDSTAVLLTVEDSQKINLVIDLGTNSEIAVGNINKYYVASTACGPALEGGSIECGMRGTKGAVERFKIAEDEIILKVIGDVEPVGICGSGIIDITAELIRCGIIDKTGRMLNKEEYSSIRPESKLSNRLVKINGINSFIIKNDNLNIYINQKDIRRIQLAKSAIYSGCMALIKAYGITLNDVGEVILAGAFGNYIDVDNSIYIGLLPDLRHKIRTIGNGAGKGVSMYLLNKEKKKKCDLIVENTLHYELANDKIFVNEYINNMNF